MDSNNSSYIGMYLRLKLFSSTFGNFFSLILNPCVCVHIKVVFENIFYLTILNLSLYDVKYKCTFNIKICIRVMVFNQNFNLKNK